MLRFASEPAYQANYCRSNLRRPFALENSNGFEQILAHRIGCQRAKPPCLAERHSYSPRSISEGTKIVNTRLSISTAILRRGAKCMRRGTMREKRDWRPVAGGSSKNSDGADQRPGLSARILDCLKKQQMMRPGDRVGVAVSGGADSVALLLLLQEFREKLGIVLSVVHFNHKLRGKASDADEKFVANLAAKHGLEFHTASVHVAQKAKKERTNLEDAARRARYDYFHSLVESGALTRIAVAHTADDQAETVLAHILRGTGLTGLGGIHPVAGPIIRPLLKIRRAELRAYLRAKKQKWREDATKRDTTRTRARIRRKLLPLLEKQFQPAIVEHLTTLAELAREDESFLKAVVARRAAELVQKGGEGLRIAAIDLLEPLTRVEEAQALSKRLVRHIVKSLKPRSGQLGAGHVNAVLELARQGKSGASLPLPGAVEVRRERDALAFHAVGERFGSRRGGSARSRTGVCIPLQGD